MLMGREPAVGVQIGDWLGSEIQGRRSLASVRLLFPRVRYGWLPRFRSRGCALARVSVVEFRCEMGDPAVSRPWVVTAYLYPCTRKGEREDL
jgi:hypothetical protein